MKLLFSLSEQDHGPGPIYFQWQTGGSYIATYGCGSGVHIYDKRGELVEEIVILGSITSIVWDKGGDILAIIGNKSNLITLWDVNTRKISHIDSSLGAKDPLTFALWSRKSAVLAVGNSKGNLLLYNHQTARKIPILGKHRKKITFGAFSDNDLLALCSDDFTISISNLEGDTEYNFACNEVPCQIKFAEMKEAERSSQGETTISMVVGTKALLLLNLNDPENPYNLQFQPRYGNIITYSWFGDGYILIGFYENYLVCISTHSSEIGQEVFSVNEFRNYLSWVGVSSSFEKSISVGDNMVKLREMSQLSDVYAIIEVEEEQKALLRAEINDDGQLLAVSGQFGSLHVYLTKLPILGDCHGNRIAVLTSLTEITVINEIEHEPPLILTVDVEPTFLGIGTSHVATGMNNIASFFRLLGTRAELIRNFEYVSSVQSVKLNEIFAAALLEGRVQLHKIDTRGDEEEETGRIFPNHDKIAFKITSIGLTNEFLIISTDVLKRLAKWTYNYYGDSLCNGGHIQYFSLEDWKYVNEFRHTNGIRAIFPEPAGTRLCIFDDRKEALIYSPIDDSLITVPQNNDSSWPLKGVIWDAFQVERDIFSTFDSNSVYIYCFFRNKFDGPQLVSLGSAKLPFGHIPLLLFAGNLTSQTPNGKTSNIQLACLRMDMNFEGKTNEYLEETFSRCLLLKRWSNAWRICNILDDTNAWLRFGVAAMENCAVDLAIRIYRQIGNVCMVWSLEEICTIEDHNLLSGHLAMIMEKFHLAEKLFLESSNPIKALEMRRDLLHWDKALQLAMRLAPEEIPNISKEYAQQLEFVCDYSNALYNYEQGIIEGNDSAKINNEICLAGIARMSLRIGDIHRGAKLALESSSTAVKRDCAHILESMKQYNDAAIIYENGQFFDRAAAVCIKAKNWMKVGELLPSVHSPKIHSQYGKAMEANGKFKQAAMAYKNARDCDNLVRILLDHLHMPDEAVKIVKESRSVEGAKLVAKFFGQIDDYSSAIQFLLLSQCHQEAFQLAVEHQKMEIYAQVIEDEGTEDQYRLVAEYFENRRKSFIGGKFFYLAGHFKKGLDLLLSNGEDHEAIKVAIECVGKANDDKLTKQLVDFLMGENDGIPKDAKYLFRMYMALKMHREAAKTAVMIAREEQNRGGYRIAHNVLFGMHQELLLQAIPVPRQMDDSLMLIHSYLIVKILIRRGDHVKAARMLIRIANNISRFPAHNVQILTSTVIECSKAGLKQAAFQFAALLMRPENRKKLDEKYRKKIETIVRKSDKNGLKDEETKSACPFCDILINESELVCSFCQNTLPFCIITGRHIVKDDFALCPSCHFPAYYSELKRAEEAEESCPMCGVKLEKIDRSDVQVFLCEKNNYENEVKDRNLIE